MGAHVSDFFKQPILNSPYEYPGKHWELDETGQPTQNVKESRRIASFITPIPKPKKRRGKKASAEQQKEIVFADDEGLSTEKQQYDPNPVINGVVLDSDWEAEFCRIAEKHPAVRAYVKNHGLGLEVPYRFMGKAHKYRPDFIVIIDTQPDLANASSNDPVLANASGYEFTTRSVSEARRYIHLVVEIKGYRGEAAREKANTMKTYWIPGVNNLGTCGRWAFAEFTEVFQMEADFEQQIAGRFDQMVDDAIRTQPDDRKGREEPTIRIIE